MIHHHETGNFLTFRPTTKYAAIVMNPPFSAGAARLLKALDVMQDGGKVRCLLNAETLRNPCTNERKELAAKLEELHATVKYIPDAFKNARRAARVEVALVSVDIPDREPVSRIRLDLKNETAERLKENPEFAALVSSDPITAAIERYNAAAEGVRRIYEEILERGDCLSLRSLAVTGNDLIRDGVKPGPALGDILNKLLEEVLEHPEKNEKEYLLEKSRSLR